MYVLSKSQLNKSKSTIKNGIGIAFNLSSNITSDANDKNKFQGLVTLLQIILQLT